MPFSDECPPLVSPGYEPRNLLLAADQLRRDAGAVSLQVRAAIPGDTRQRQEAWTSTLALPKQVEDLDRIVRHSLRRQARSAAAQGVTVRVGRRLRDMDSFFRLHQGTRRRLGAPVQPRRYFTLLWQLALAPGHGVLLLAEWRGEVIAAAIFLQGGQTVTYKYGASDRLRWSLFPNQAIFWTALSQSIGRGFSEVDFGRSDFGQDGLKKFKENWGAESRPLYYTWTTPPQGRDVFRATSKLLRPLIQHSPSLVARGLGELFYRFAA
jgi:CelD/BcsL family acetyltransferase involved in cellulose biosynthesis